MTSLELLPKFLNEISADLDRSVQFWLKHSHDDKYGGFFNCVGKEGDIYDDTKYGWLQGRQVWAYARLYNEVDRFKTSEILAAAERGAEFIMRHLRHKDTWKCCIQVTRDGKPIYYQRTIFTECFYLMGMSEVARATGKQLYREEAVGMMEKIVQWVRGGHPDWMRPVLEGTTRTNSLAVPMMLLALINQLTTMDRKLTEEYAELTEYCVKLLMAHIQRDGQVVLEHVSVDGKELPGSEGRLFLPGHVMEGGWFLLELASLNPKYSYLRSTAIKSFIVDPFTRGWDKEHGGIFYFLDVDDFCPVQLEWNMKLWWVHNEAMIAFLMAFKETGDQAHLDRFQQVFDYSYRNFVDKECGEWYGYLNQQGKVNNSFKGGPWKGCFHLLRCLMVCEKLLKDLISNENGKF